MSSYFTTATYISAKMNHCLVLTTNLCNMFQIPREKYGKLIHFFPDKKLFSAYGMGE